MLNHDSTLVDAPLSDVLEKHDLAEATLPVQTYVITSTAKYGFSVAYGCNSMAVETSLTPSAVSSDLKVKITSTQLRERLIGILQRVKEANDYKEYVISHEPKDPSASVYWSIHGLRQKAASGAISSPLPLIMGKLREWIYEVAELNKMHVVLTLSNNCAESMTLHIAFEHPSWKQLAQSANRFGVLRSATWAETARRAQTGSAQPEI
jgi:hypothetical protein